jgi:hypothetical protein
MPLCRNLVGNPKCKKLLGKPRRRRNDTIKMDLEEIVGKGVDWINMTHYRDKSRAVVNTVMKLQVRELRSYGLLRSEKW